MASGVDKLLEAAEFLEQQEKLKQSPPPIGGGGGAVLAAYALNGHTSPSNIIISSGGGGVGGSHNVIARLNGRFAAATAGSHIVVSSSAPAAAPATFQHAAGGQQHQQQQQQQQQQHYQLGQRQCNGGGVGGGELVAFELSNGAGAGSGRSTSESRMSVEPLLAATSSDRPSTDSTTTTARHGHNNNNTTTNNNNNTIRTGASLLLLSPKSAPPQQQQQQQSEHEQQQQQPPPKHHTADVAARSEGALISLAALAGHHAFASAVAASPSKQMLLNGGFRIVAPGAIAVGGVATKPLAIPQRALPFPHHQKSSLPPLTPPAGVARKMAAEPYGRIRSFSLSHKLAGNAMLMDTDTHMAYLSVAAGGSGVVSAASASPSSAAAVSPGGSPRQSQTGAPYLQLSGAAAAAGVAGSQVTHVLTSPVGLGGITAIGRRRTISSNSNGAGTREVHNKLEKNRRAHLKECYESLRVELLLGDDDRKKTSNLAILGEAHRTVMTLQKEDKDLEMATEQLSRDKIKLQKKISTLQRELGGTLEQQHFPDKETVVAVIPHDRGETMNDSVSLSSGRGSMLYSSTSSISSGGSNTMSSPLGAGSTLQAATSPVIHPSSSTSSHHHHHIAATASVLVGLKGAATLKSAHNSPVGSPAAGAAAIAAPLSLTAKNISATSLTRGSPTPTPAPPTSSPTSSSSSSGVSSGSASVSPPIGSNGGGGGGGGVLNGNRSVTVNIPNGLKFHATGAVTGTVAGGAAAAIMANVSGPNSNNAHRAALPAAPNGLVAGADQPPPQPPTGAAAKAMAATASKTPALGCAGEDVGGQQPAKLVRINDGSSAGTAAAAAPTSKLQLTQVVGGGSLVVSPTYLAQAAEGVGRLPGGAELNLLPPAGIGSIGTFYHANGKFTFVSSGGGGAVVENDHQAGLTECNKMPRLIRTAAAGGGGGRPATLQLNGAGELASFVVAGGGVGVGARGDLSLLGAAVSGGYPPLADSGTTAATNYNNTKAFAWRGRSRGTPIN